MNILRTIRNNWKKSVFGFCALSYGAKWSHDRYQANQIRQFYCRKASQLGAQPFPSMTHLSRVAVLLNGQANNGKAKSIYDKTIFPLLSLIGLDVRVYRLDTITDPKVLQELLTNKIEPNALNAIIIVGGDGTLSEVAPYFIQSDALRKLPICVVPIAEHASFARSLFPTTTKKKLHDDVALLCESVFSLFYGTVVQKSLLKITKPGTDEKPIYASTLDFGHYSRLEQLQKRLWYFSYLKYPISSIYHSLKTSVNSILSDEQPYIMYSKPCSGCLRCRPSLLDEFRSSQQEKKPSFFSRLYQSNRSNVKQAAIQPLVAPTENPDCGVEYSEKSENGPVQLWIQMNSAEQNIQVDVSDKLERFNYNKETYPKQPMNVQHIRFDPKSNLLEKHMFINHEKLDMKKQEEQGKNDNTPIEYRIELSEVPLKFLQVNSDSLLKKQPTYDKLEEQALEKKGIFLFSHRYKNIQLN